VAAIRMRANPLPRLIANLDFRNVAQENLHKPSQLITAVEFIL